MSEVHPERARFQSTQALLSEVIKAEEAKITALEAQIQAGEVEKGEGFVQVCNLILYVASCYLAVNRAAVHLVGSKYIDAINSARRNLYRALKALEAIVPSKLSLLGDQDASSPPGTAVLPLELKERYRLLQKFALAIRLMVSASGDNQKLRWTFLDLEGRFAGVAMNIIDMRGAIKNVIAMEGEYLLLNKVFALQKKLLYQAAVNYRTRFEQSAEVNAENEDLRLGIQYMDVLVHFASLTNDPELKNYKEKLDLWDSKRT